MKALLIKPAEQSIEAIELSSKEEIIKLIGFDTVIADDLGGNGDKLYFDEECFLRGNEGRFKIDNLIPVSGIGVVVGSNDDGTLADIQSDIEDIKSRTSYL